MNNGPTREGSFSQSDHLSGGSGGERGEAKLLSLTCWCRQGDGEKGTWVQETRRGVSLQTSVPKESDSGKRSQKGKRIL